MSDRQIAALIKVLWVVAVAMIGGVASLFIAGWQVRDTLVTKQDLATTKAQIDKDLDETRAQLGKDIDAVTEELKAAEGRVTQATRDGEGRLAGQLARIESKLDK